MAKKEGIEATVAQVYAPKREALGHVTVKNFDPWMQLDVYLPGDEARKFQVGDKVKVSIERK